MIPVAVMTGISELRSACRMMVLHSRKPFARAVRMKSWSSTSSIADRVMRARKPIWNSARIAAGCASEAIHGPNPAASGAYPVVGSQCRLTLNRIIDRIATQNDGTERSSSASAMIAESSQVCRQHAASTPSPTPIGTVMASDTTVSESVTGSRCATAASTPWFSTSERPKSPRAMLASHTSSCSRIGRSSPSCWRMRSTAAGLASGPAITMAGSPGRRCISRNVSVATIRMTGTDCTSRVATRRNAAGPDGGGRLLYRHVPEAREVVGLYALILGVVRAHRRKIGDLDHVRLLEHALLDRQPRGLAVIQRRRCVELLIGLVDDRLVLQMREADQQRAPLLRPEQRPRTEPGRADVPSSGAAHHVVAVGRPVDHLHFHVHARRLHLLGKHEDRVAHVRVVRIRLQDDLLALVAGLLQQRLRLRRVLEIVPLRGGITWEIRARLEHQRRIAV